MALETVTDIDDLVVTNPTASDPKSQGDDHIRNIKTALKNGFAGFTGSILVTGTDGGSANTYTVTPTNAVPAYASRMIVIFSPAANNTGASTINISGLGAKSIKSVSGAALTSGDLVTGTIYSASYDGTDFRLLSITKNYADQLAFSTAFPSQTGNADKIPTTDGTNVSWTDALKATVIRLVDGTDTTKKLAFDLSGITTATTRTLTPPNYSGTIATLAGTETLTNKTIPIADNAFTLQDNGDATKQVQFQLSGISTGTTRTITIGDANFTLEASLGKPLSTVTASNSATVDIETTFDGTGDAFLIIATDVTVQNDGAALRCQMKVSGAYDTGANYKYHTENSLASAATYAGQASTGQSYINTIFDIGNAASEGANLRMWVYKPSGTSRQKMVDFSGSAIEAAGNVVKVVGSGLNTSTGALTGIRFLASSGNIVSGSFRLYVIKNS